MMACGAIPPGDAFVAPMLAFLDCQATTLGAAGYRALAAPGSSAMLVLTASLTILIAILGYRMLLGETPTVREGVVTFVRIGIVLAFATSWPAYRTVVYDVTLRAPADLAAEIGGPAGIPGTTGGLTGRLDNLDRAFRTLAIYGTGVPTREQVERSGGAAPPLFAGFDGFALGAARIAFLIGSVGAFALIRLNAGLLLALGPLFLAFLLFDGTRGLFEGWLRGLVAMALGGVASSIALGIELALFEPWLAELVSRRAAGEAIPNAATSLFAAALIFLIVLFASLALTARLVAGLRLPERMKHAIDDRHRPPADPARRTMDAVSAAGAPQTRSRALVIADQVTASQRREEQALGGTRSITIAGMNGRGDRGDAQLATGAVPLGRSFRRTRGRISASATTRDRMA